MIQADGQVAKRVREICEGLLRGEPQTYDEFAELWPRGVEGVALYAQIYEDCENALEHTPAHLISGRINWRSWLGSGLYELVRLDSLIAGLVVDGMAPDDAVAARSHALSRREQGARPPWEDLLDEWLRERGP